MPKEKEVDLAIEVAKEGDWEGIMEGFIEGTYRSLGPSEREELGPSTVRERTQMQAEWVRSPEGFFNEAFVARNEEGSMVGHVWVARVRNQFTGRSEGLVLNLFVEEDFRMMGAAKRLLQVAEEWAMGQDLDRIGLSVAVDNEPGVRLFETMEYTSERQVMMKRL